MFGVAYRGGSNLWIAGRGGAILRRIDSIATVSIPVPKLPPALRPGGPPKIQSQSQVVVDDGDIPRAVPNDKKPVRPN